METSVQYLLAGLTSGSIYALVALGFTLVYNASGVVNFAQGEFVVLGGIFTAWLHVLGVPLVLAALAAIIATGVVAGVAHVCTISRVPGLDTFGLLMITAGLGIVLRTLVLIFWGSEERTFPSFSSGESINILGGTLPPQAMWILAAVFVTMPLLYLLFSRTRVGDAMMGASDNREGAALVGIRTSRVSVGAFVLAACLAAFAGVLITPITTISFTMGLAFTLKGFTAAVLGGFGSPVGAVVGGLALGVIEKFGAGYISTGYEGFISLAVLLLMLMFLPRGIVGSRSLEG